MVTFDDVRVFFEKLLKIFPVFAGSFYIIGYIVTAIRLSQYNLPAVKLLDAQYFFAGALVGGVIWLAIFILLSASLYKDNKPIRYKMPIRKDSDCILLGNLFVICIR